MTLNIKTTIRDNGKTIILKSNLSNHNIIYMKFMRDGSVFDIDDDITDRYFKHNSYNWWIALYIGPRWKRLFSFDNRCYGSTKCPLEGLVASRRLIQYFIDNYMGPTDVLEASGSTRQRDEIYYKVLTKMGFRYTPLYYETVNLMIYAKDNGTPEYLDNDEPNLDNPWGSMRYNGVKFPEEPDWQDEDYEGKSTNMLMDYLEYYIKPITGFFYELYIDMGVWLGDVQSDIKRLFKKKPRKTRKS